MSNSAKPTWKELGTDGRCALATRVADGRLMTAKELAAEIGDELSGPAPSRNAIIGMIARHSPAGVKLTKGLAAEGYRKRRKTTAKGSPRTPRRSNPGLPKTACTKPVDRMAQRTGSAGVAIRSLEITLFDLEPGQCKFATNNAATDEEHLFCGHPVKEGSSYCATHHRACYSSRDTAESRIKASIRAWSWG